MKAEPVLPMTAAATANSIVANATPLAPCWHLWHPEAVVFQWKCDRPVSPSWATERMCVALHVPGVAKRGLPIRGKPRHDVQGENLSFFCEANHLNGTDHLQGP